MFACFIIFSSLTLLLPAYPQVVLSMSYFSTFQHVFLAFFFLLICISISHFYCQAQLNLQLQLPSQLWVEFSITLQYPNHPTTRISSESSAPDRKNILSQSKLHLNCLWSTSMFHLSYIWVASSCIQDASKLHLSSSKLNLSSKWHLYSSNLNLSCIYVASKFNLGASKFI